jgi:hypothetical protein
MPKITIIIFDKDAEAICKALTSGVVPSGGHVGKRVVTIDPKHLRALKMPPSTPPSPTRKPRRGARRRTAKKR